MIVRCTNCNSAFAVKDEKVANKKFAFNCPKCSAENIIDNKETGLEGQESGMFEGAEGFESPKPRVGTATTVQDDFDSMPEFETEPAARPQVKKPVPEEDLDLGNFDLGDEKTGSDLTGNAGPADELRLDDMVDAGKKPVKSDLDLDFDIDNVIEPEDTGAAKKTAKADDEFNIDLGDELVADDLSSAGSRDAIPAGRKKDTGLDLGSEINGFDELGDIPVYEQEKEISSKQGISGKTAEEELLADFEPLELESGQPSSKQRPGSAAAEPDDFFTESPSKEKIKTEQVYSKEEADEDESITIDLDSLEIDLDEGADVQPKGKPAGKTKKSEADEDITLDLDTLDIDLAEGETISEGEKPDILDSIDFFAEPVKPASKTRPRDEEDITLDLDSLDIQLDETSEIKKGEVPEDDEKITLEDAGLTIEELTSDELSSVTSSKQAPEEEEDIKLSIDDIDPTLSVDNIEKELKEADDIIGEESLTDKMSLLDSDEDIPDIDFESFGDETPAEKGRRKREDLLEEDLIDIESERETTGTSRTKITHAVPGGSVSLSADYSIKYSRSGAFLRLVMLFLLGMIPHFVVLTLYTVLSVILGFINNLVVLATRQAIEDFSEIQENTIRYFLSITASMMGFIEEMPIFAGRERIDYALQMNVISPYQRSRLLSVLRLSFIGIIVAALPHLLILGLLAVVLLPTYFMGIFSILFTGRWPFFLFDFLTRYYRYAARVLAYIAGLVDRYPTFRFD